MEDANDFLEFQIPNLSFSFSVLAFIDFCSFAFFGFAFYSLWLLLLVALQLQNCYNPDTLSATPAAAASALIPKTVSLQSPDSQLQ